MGEPGLDWWVRWNTSEEVTFKLSVRHNTQILNVHMHPFRNSPRPHRHKQCRTQIPPCPHSAVPHCSLWKTSLVGNGLAPSG